MSEEEYNEEDVMEEEAELRAEINQEVAEGYGAPMPEEKINQFKITQDAIKSRDNVKTTFLTKGELGRPMFSVRFYLDCAEMAKIYNAHLVEKYFKNKVKTITQSGMSNEGFIMKLNVTNRRDVIKRRQSPSKSLEEERNP